MTSMPASRSARAMIFAPRSWPSRPGLATTTRILPAVRLGIPRRLCPPPRPRGDVASADRAGADASGRRKRRKQLQAARQAIQVEHLPALLKGDLAQVAI